MVGLFPYRSEVELKKLPTSTLKFILACAVVHIFTWWIGRTSEYLLLDWFVSVGFDYLFPFSALSSIFVHGDFEHLFFNMFFFWLFAGPIEVMEGKRRFWKLVIISAFFSSYFSYLLRWLFWLFPNYSAPEIALGRYFNLIEVSIGASGVVSAFAGAYLLRFWKSRLYAVLTLGGLPVKRIIISPWVMVLGFWFLNDMVRGIIFQGLFPSTYIDHFAHLGGFICGFFLAWRWGFHKNMKRDWLCQQAEELASAPYTGGEASLKTYQQALELDPKNGRILLEIARLCYFLGREEESEKYYRRAVIRLFEQGEEKLLTKAYQEAVKRFELVFLSEKELELVRILLKEGDWQSAKKALEKYIAQIEKNLHPAGARSCYLRANLILADILDHYLHHPNEARELIRRLDERFPGHPLLKYPLQRLEVCREERLFYFNPQLRGFPFAGNRLRGYSGKKPLQAERENPPRFFSLKFRRGFLFLLLLSVPFGFLLFYFLIWVVGIFESIWLAFGRVNFFHLG